MGPSRSVCRLIDIDKFADVEHDGAEILQGTALGQAGLRLCNRLAGCGLGRIDLVDEQRALGQVQFQFVGAHGTAFSGLAFARQRVAVVEWGLARDSYSTAEYLGLDAIYFQLQPKWSRNATVAECAATGVMDDCPWHLGADDVRRYLALVDELVRDKGAALLAPARGARVHVRTLDELRGRAEALRVS